MKKRLAAILALAAANAVLGSGLSAQAPARVEITPDQAEVEVTGTLRLEARALDGAGREIPGAAVRWIASTPELASVDEDGVVTGLNAGMARITAVAGRCHPRSCAPRSGRRPRLPVRSCRSAFGRSTGWASRWTIPCSATRAATRRSRRSTRRG